MAEDTAMLDAEVAAAVERVRRAVDPETLDEAVFGLIQAARPHIEAELRERLTSEEALKALCQMFWDCGFDVSGVVGKEALKAALDAALPTPQEQIGDVLLDQANALATQPEDDLERLAKDEEKRAAKGGGA